MEQLGAREGYAELRAGAQGVGLQFRDVFVRAEVGWKPTANSALFAFGEASATGFAAPAWMAGVGARVTW